MLFTLALGLNSPWKVVRSGLEDGGAESKFLNVDIEVEAGAQMPCPVCAQPCPLYDHEVKRWRHLIVSVKFSKRNESAAGGSG